MVIPRRKPVIDTLQQQGRRRENARHRPADAAWEAGSAGERYRDRKLHSRLNGTRLIRTPPRSVTRMVSLGLTPMPRAVS